MKYPSILPLAMVFATTFAVGQANYQRPLRMDPANCPVGLQVKHEAGLPAGPRVNGKPLNGEVQPSLQNQSFNLTMTNLSFRDIVSAEMTAHGLSHNWRVILVSDTDKKPDLAKTVDVALDVKGNGSASHELSFADFAVIRTIDVNSVTYADGSSWHASSPGAC